MVKRVYIESVKKWGIRAGIPATTMVGLLFAYLTFLGAIEITGFSGDQVCAGTIDDPCYAYVNLTAKEDIFIYPVGYDPWGRDTIFEFTPGVKDWKLQRSWGKGWRDIPLNKTCTGTWCGAPNSDGVAYSYVLREDRDYQFRVVAYKHNPKDKIKWAVNYEDREYLDPVWLPTTDYTIDGNKVYINDSRVYIEVYPHTARNGEWVTFNVTSKIYSGDIDIVLGFNMSEMRPQGVRKYNPTNETRQRSYKCNYEFNYTTDPKYATCYEDIYVGNNETNETEYSHTRILFNRTFETGNLTGKTVYWTEEYVDEFKQISNDVFNSVEYDYQGINRWYYYKNLTIEQGVANAYQVKIKSIDPWGTNSKYWFGIKPSHLTIQEAIEQDKFYAIDPWTIELNDGLVSYWKFDTDADDSLGLNNGTVTSAVLTTGSGGIIGEAYNFSPNGLVNIEVSTLSVGSTLTFNVWLKNDHNNHNQQYVFASNGGTGLWFFGYDESADGWGLLDQGSPAWEYAGDTNYYDGIWKMWTIVQEGTDLKFYLDGDSIQNYSNGNSHSIDTLIRFGSHSAPSSGAGGYNGLIDEPSIWNRTLSHAEVLQLWNDGNGITFIDVFVEIQIIDAESKPDIVFSNTDWLINITATNPDEIYMDAYVQFYVNSSEVGSIQTFNLTNNTNTLIAIMGSGNFTFDDNLKADIWVSNRIQNSTNTTLQATVQFFNMSGTLKDGDGNNLNATVFIVNQTDDSLLGNTTSLNGVWTFGPIMPGTYIVTGYDPNNSTLDGDSDPHVVVPI